MVVDTNYYFFTAIRNIYYLYRGISNSAFYLHYILKKYQIYLDLKN